MLPVIAIVGRANVGKSTLFNVLTQTRNALVADQPGLTRDRQVGTGRIGQRDYLLTDTGGFTEEHNIMAELINQQVFQAVKESDTVLFLVDGKNGLTATDENIVRRLRPLNKPIYLVINKTEGLESTLVSAEFYRLGLEKVYTISAAHQQGITRLMDNVLAHFPQKISVDNDEPSPPSEEEGIKITVIGRPNVGKSTLINQLLGYERVITCDQPGTTRDSIYIPLEHQGQRYILVDTAGVRRRPKVVEFIEKISIIKTLQAITDTHLVIMLLDAQEGVTDQDAHLLGQVLEQGRALIIAVNKWDGLSPEQRQQVRYHLTRKLHFIDFAKIHFISALHGRGVNELFGSISIVWQAACSKISTPRLNQALQQAVITHQPPMIRGRRIKLRYIHQGGHNPPLFVIHGNQVDEIPENYKHYLINFFRDAFTLEGTPIRLEFRQGENPYQNRKNVLTIRQQKKRRRLLEHVHKR